MNANLHDKIDTESEQNGKLSVRKDRDYEQNANLMDETDTENEQKRIDEKTIVWIF